MSEQYETNYVVLSKEEYEDMLELISILKQEIYKLQKTQS